MCNFFKLILHCKDIQEDVGKNSIELSNITLFTSLISILFKFFTIYTLDLMIWLLLLFLIGGFGRILYTYGNQRLRYYFFGDISTFFSIYFTLITILIYLIQIFSSELLILKMLPLLCIGIIFIMLVIITLNLVKEYIHTYYDMYKKTCTPEREHWGNNCEKCKYYEKVIKNKTKRE